MSRARALVMAYGSPAGPEGVEAYYTHIRRGRPPTPEQLADLRARYEAIGGVSPLRAITERQRRAIARHLERADGADHWVVALGNKHAAPFVEDGVTVLARTGVDVIVGLVLAPHFSATSVGAYHDRAAAAAATHGVTYVGIDEWHLDDALISFHAAALAEARATCARPHKVLFSAHSLPERVLADDPYPDQLHATASAIAERCGLARWADWAVCWQSAGRTPERWRGPDILTVLGDLAATGRAGGVVVAAVGFTADHLELRYDLDIEAAAAARRLGLAFARTRAINDDDAVMASLAARIRNAHPDAAPALGSAPDARRSTVRARDRAHLRVAVVGAGVSGLSAARAVLRDLPGAELTVCEASERVGGKIHTTEVAGVPVDCAADAFVTRVPDAVDLCRDLGLKDRLVTPATTTAMLYLDGALLPYPSGTVLGVPLDPGSLRGGGVLSDEGIDRALAEAELGAEEWPGPGRDDESVGSLVRRRLGDEVFERLVAPLLAGVNAGDADELSVRAGAPQFAAAMEEHGALLAGLRARAGGSCGDKTASTEEPSPIFAGLRGGTQVLTDALAADVVERGGSIRTSSRAVGLEPLWSPGASHPVYRLRLDDPAGGDTIHCDAVVLATPTGTTARLLGPFAPSVATTLDAVDYASVVLVTFAVARSAICRPMDASGFLVAPGEGLLLTACSWASSKWAHLAPAPTGPARGGASRGDDAVVLLRASAGRVGDERASVLDDEALVEHLLADLDRTMGLTGRPVEVRVSRWPGSLPQFRPGHLTRMAQAAAELQQAYPGLFLAGAGVAGIGIPACIRHSHEIAISVRDIGLTWADRR